MFEDIEKMIEEGVKKVVAEVEKKPFATMLKGIIVLYVIKKILRWFR